MNEKLMFDTDKAYQTAERKASLYYQSLYEQMSRKTYIPALTKDFQTWKQNHVYRKSLFSVFTRKNNKPEAQDYDIYIQWLKYTGKLTPYLERSISYLYMRDLGKDLSSTKTQERVNRVVESLTSYLTRKPGKTDTFNMAGLYRLAQKENIETTMIWLVNKLKSVTSNIPEEIDPEQARRKLIKIIAGVVMHVVEEMDEGVEPTERALKLDQAIRLGYCYGLTYPFIDDLLDVSLLSAEEKKRYSNLIRKTLITGSVPDLGQWSGNNAELLQYIHSELREAFEYIKGNQQSENMQSFLEQAYIFFQSQEADRVKDLSNPDYKNEDIYIPVILKSASSRLIVRSVLSASEDEDFNDRTFYYGIYNQLADDFADMFDDLEEGAVTPYTYYLKYHVQRPDLINPFELYWTVISNLIHNVYKSDPKTREVILNRAINGLKRYKRKMGTEKYNEVMKLFSPDSSSFTQLIQKMVKKADDVDFFDKLLRDHMLNNMRNERKEQEEFLETIKFVRNQLNDTLRISEVDEGLNSSIVEAANYSLNGDGKRLRPIVTWVMAIKVYGLEQSAIMPLLKSLEYMHTASLIFDDLPSQDNASTRRGRQTLHQAYNTAIAELTGLFLTQKAMWEQASLRKFDSNTVLKLIQYSSYLTAEMCKGQAMDLESKGKPLSLDQLNLMCFYKTGMAFEASIIMPAILAHADETEIETLKKYAYHAGIAFQIKDDLLDFEGDPALLGKTVGKDRENQSSTFVSILGQEEARKKMWEHYCQAIEALQKIPREIPFLKHFLNYLINRDH
ncbi:polyprenyl synthetase family protein [Metabacillus litoralis]|uniref:polyprenyl synthetase family protein n=1 Tax=Metabacillus litoralis TaxID=152268 RepID=UPI001B9A15D8|nr:polyprenyl synthetase family protein [Metabacillus litoralis]UHA60709.1 polyprenyl synthetase family protein [Metabacillus litoralis]